MKFPFIIAQREATSWGFQIWRAHIDIHYPKFWRTSGLTRGFKWDASDWGEPANLGEPDAPPSNRP